MKAYLPGLIAAGATLLTAGAAAAQPADWAGPYAGLNAGWNSSSTTVSRSNVIVNPVSGLDAGDGTGVATVPASTFGGQAMSLSHNGFIGGGQLGYNIVTGPVVWGVEGDFDGLSGGTRQGYAMALPATALTTGGALDVSHYDAARWTASIRGRVGFSAGKALFYVTGGPAWVNLRERASYGYAPAGTAAAVAANPAGSFGPFANGDAWDRTHLGWTAGAGVDVLTTRNMTFGFEYRHTDTGSFDTGFYDTAANTASENFRSHFRDDAVLARVNFKFGR